VSTEHGGQCWIGEQGEQDAAGCTISQDDSPEARVELAYWLQEQFFAETRGAWGEARPDCPEDGHRRRPTVAPGPAGGLVR
jgi:hypothetical protein